MMKLAKELTTVTTLSKTLAAILFITLPFLGFFLGETYQKNITAPSTIVKPPNIPYNSPSPNPDPTANWKTYTNKTIGLQMKYPSDYADAFQAKSDQGWILSDDWGTINLYKIINQDLYTIIFFPFSGTLDDLQAIRNKIPSTPDYASLNHPTIPSTFPDVTNALLKTITIDGYSARWYKVKWINSLDSTTVNEIHFIVKNHGFIFRNENPYFNEEEMNQILSTFKFTDNLSAISPTIDQTNANGTKSCQTDTDCSSDQFCTQAGPIVVDPTTKQPMNKKTCWQKGSAVPL